MISNLQGLLTSKVDANAKAVTYTYTAAGQPYQRTWARGVVTTYAYSSTTGEQTGITYSDGTPTVSFSTYNRQGLPTSISDHTGTRTLEYCDCGKPLYEILPSAFYGNRKVNWKIDATTSGALGRTYGVSVSENNVAEYDQTYGFDSSGRFNSVAGFTYTYTPNSHLLATIAHSASGWAQYRTYLPNANALDIIETKVSTTSKAKFDHTHDALYRATTILKTGDQFTSTYGSTGLETDYAYDDKSQLTADSTTLGGSSTPLANRDDYHAYDPIGNRTSVNRSGTTITYTPNLLNQYTAITGSANPTYDDDGNLLSDGVWDYVWDGEGRLASQTNVASASPRRKLEFKYDYLHRRVRMTVSTWSSSAWTVGTDLKFVYDGWNKVLELDALTSNAKARAHIWGLDLSGSRTGAGGVGGLLYTYHYPTAKALLPAYDGNGNVSGYLDSSGGGWLAKYEYDAFGQLVSSTGSHADLVPYRFSTKYADPHTGHYDYGRRLYDPKHARFLGRDPIGESNGVRLWGLGLSRRNLIPPSPPNPMAPTRSRKTSDRLGQTSTVADHTGTRTFTYNLSGTLELQTEQLGSFYGDRRLDWTYDTTGSGTKGRLIQTGLGSYGTAHSIHNQTYTYASDGRLNGHVLSASGYASQTFAYTYTTNSHLLASTVNTALGYTDVRTYDAQRNWLDQRETKWGATPKAKFVYDQDNLGRVTTAYKTGEVFNIYGNGTQGIETDFAYDDKSQLTADSTVLGGTTTPLSGRDDYHTYDPIGNRTAVNRSGTNITYTANNLNQYTSFTGSATHTYDDDGNLTSDGRWDYFYDAENRLTIAQTTAAAVAAGQPNRHHWFKYDHAGRRVRYVDFNWSGGTWVPVTERRMIYRGWQQIAEYWGAYNAGNLVTTNVRHDHWGLDLSGTLGGAGGVSGLLLQHNAGETYLPAYDALGNVHGMIKASDGTLGAIYEYDAFGQTIRASGSYAAVNPFRFATNYTDSEIGLVNNKTRFYLPNLGRFLNRDTIGERGGLHLYAYVINNPANLYDPFGRDAQGKSAWVPGRGYFYSSWSPGGSSGSPGGGGGGGGADQDVVIEVTEPDGSKSYYVHRAGNGVSLAPGAAVATAPAGFSLGSSVSVSFSGGAPTIHSSGVTAVPMRQGNVIIGEATVIAYDVLAPVGGLTPTPRSNLPDLTEADIRAGFMNSSRGRAADPFASVVNGFRSMSMGNSPSDFSGVGSAALSAIQVKVIADAGYGPGVSGSVYQDIGGSNTNVDVDGALMFGASIMAGFEGEVPLTSSPGNALGSAGLNVGAGLALGISTEFAMRRPFGGAIEISLPTNIQFFLGVGFGLDARLTPPTPAAKIYTTDPDPRG